MKKKTKQKNQQKTKQKTKRKKKGKTEERKDERNKERDTLTFNVYLLQVYLGSYQKVRLSETFLLIQVR